MILKCGTFQQSGERPMPESSADNPPKNREGWIIHNKMPGQNDIDSKKGKYTCNDYREEMILLGLKRRLYQQNLGEEERKEILREIENIEKSW